MAYRCFSATWNDKTFGQMWVPVEHIQDRIREAALEYAKEHNLEDDFPEYRTASITQYSRFGRTKARYWYSKIDNQWHRDSIPITNYMSWGRSSACVPTLMRGVLNLLGYKKRQSNYYGELFKQFKE